MTDTNDKSDTGKTLLIGPTASLEIHPLALAFPAYGETDLSQLADDIRDHGMRQPVTLFEGKVLDGRNRVDAAKKAGLIEIIAFEFEGTFEQARDYVISMNLVRRHLDTGQRSMIAADLAKMQRGRPSKGSKENPQNCGLSTKAAAEQLKVSTRSVETAKAIREADPALAENVKQGKTKLADAAKIAAKKVPAVGAGGGANGVEAKRHDERMKSARYMLEAFIRDYFDMSEWKELCEAIKKQLGAKHV
jgi:ParB-like chromosome segregation protein Spo0J